MLVVIFEAGVKGVVKVDGNNNDGCESVLVVGVGGEATVVTKGVNSPPLPPADSQTRIVRRPYANYESRLG